MDWGFILERTFSTMFGVEVMVFAMAAVGLNVQFGYAGLLNFGQVGFMAVGAYGLGVSINYFAWNFCRGRPVRCVYAIILALILGVPTLRLSADYLAIVTIAASETIRLFVRWRQMKDVTGASEGIGEFADPFYDIPLNPYNTGLRYDIGPFSYLGRDLWVLTVGWVLLIHDRSLREAIDVIAVGSGAQGDPRRRGRRTRAGQERLHVQAAGAHARRRHRCASPACCR
jgi:ABC-type branched-subunit amino acid transport system permease subunit